MRRIRMMGLCLVAMFALGAVVASVAQAAATPEWGRCEKTKAGKYTESACLTEATQTKGKYTGKYEWHSLVEEETKYTEPRCIKQAKGEYTNSTCTEKASKPHKGKYEKIGPYFTGSAGTGVLNDGIETCVGEKEGKEVAINERSAACDHLNNSKNFRSNTYVECARETNTGQAVGVDSVKDVVVTFTGCLFNGSISCQNTGKEGEIKTNPLAGHLGYLEKAAKPHPKVGVLLEPETPGGTFASFYCYSGALETTVGAGSATEGMYYKGTGHDSLIAPITPVDKPATGFEEIFTDNGEAAENEPDQFEGEGSTIHRL
jgi:hypothetical protein